MNPTIEKVLRSGLIDRSMAELMEKYQLLPDGAAEQVQEATREQMQKVVEEVVEMAEKDAIIKETRFDLERLRWPVTVATRPQTESGTRQSASPPLSPYIDGVIDRMGRYYFRVQDVREEWFIPGFLLFKKAHDASKFGPEEILEVQKLFIDDAPVAVQVTTREV
jgi:hypothetical protein